MEYPRFARHNGLLLDQKGLETFLPHGDPAFFIDGVTAFSQEDKTLTAVRQLLAHNPEFAGHFPGNPFLPLSKIEEMAFLASAVLIFCLSPMPGKLPMAVQVEKSRMKKPVKPDSTIFINTKLTKTRSPFFFFNATAVDEKGKTLAVFKELCGRSV